MHYITGDIHSKCISAVHCNFLMHAIIEPENMLDRIFLLFNCCEDKLPFKARLRVIGVGQQTIMNDEINFKVLKARNTSK